jgi:hypothetical protein
MEVSLTCLIVFLFGLWSGIKIKKHGWLSKKRLRRFYLNITGGYGPWSIGILKGDSPFELCSPKQVDNPVITGKDVDDMDAIFVADPFLVTSDNAFYIFFEAMDRKSNRAAIAYAFSDDLKNWLYGKIVVKEDFHLSFPYVFHYDSEFYMIPESSDAWSVRLYKSIRFPDKWKYIGNLISGYQYKDPIVFFHNGMWWMFVSAGKNNIMNLYFSRELLGRWCQHPMNPIIKFDKKRARAAGRVFCFNGKLYRVAQDNSVKYGRQVWAYEIVELDETTYKERPIDTKPIVGPGDEEWNRAGMHTVDVHRFNGYWIAAVDGRKF